MGSKSHHRLRRIPAVSAILESEQLKPLIDEWSFGYVSWLVKKTLADLRRQVATNGSVPTFSEIVATVIRMLGNRRADLMRPVINATGVVLHTNLGRAPLGETVVTQVAAIASGYCNLEYDILSGKRSRRGLLAGEMAAALSGAEDGLVVNNCAAAVLLCVACLADGKQVLVSRGELVQIGGGFRMPEIIAASKAILKEVGTTNRTSISDYAKNLTKSVGLVLKVHRSNFRMRGFVSEVGIAELASLAHRKRLPLVYDLGSGLVDRFGVAEFAEEPDLVSAVRAGADLVCFSGDKMLGGPQAGVIVGKRRYLEKLRKHPLYRPMRPDKLCLAALERILLLHLKGGGEVPLRRLFACSVEELQQRAQRISQDVSRPGIAAAPLRSVAGGGSTPDISFQGYGLVIEDSEGNLAERLRHHDPPLIVRQVKGKVIIDLTTVFPSQDDEITKALKRCMS